MSIQNWVTGILIIAVLAIGGYVVTRPASTPPAGATSGPDHYNFEQFLGGMSIGQGATASSTAASVTLSGSEFVNVDTLNYTPNRLAITLTLPASTTPMCTSLPVGQRRNLVIRNSTTTANAFLTLAGSASIVLKQATSTTAATADTINGTADGTSFGILGILKIPTTTSGVGCIAFLTTFN